LMNFALLLGVALTFLSKNIQSSVATEISASASPEAEASISEGPPLPLGRGSHAAGVIGGQVIVIGGTSWSADRTKKTFHNDSVVFKNGAWQAGPSIDVPLAEGAFADDGRALYLAGGLASATEPRNEVFKISPGSDGELHVEKLSPLPVALSACSAAILGSRLYVVGGNTGSDEYSNQLWSLDIKEPASRWRKEAVLPGVGRGYPALAASGRFLYLLGGLKGGNGAVHERALSDCYLYDPLSNRWKAMGNLPFAGYCWSAERIDDAHLLLAGRADGVIHKEIWKVHLPDLKVEQVGDAVIAATCAPLVQVRVGEWWLIGGEPDSNKHRTSRVTVISLPNW
jgi:N-acetylneuraminic acid mutarotase